MATAMIKANEQNSLQDPSRGVVNANKVSEKQAKSLQKGKGPAAPKTNMTAPGSSVQTASGSANRMAPPPNVNTPPVPNTGKSTPTQPEAFNKEALLILREMNRNISSTNEKVEALSGRVDALYAEPEGDGDEY